MLERLFLFIVTVNVPYVMFPSDVIYQADIGLVSCSRRIAKKMKLMGRKIKGMIKKWEDDY